MITDFERLNFEIFSIFRAKHKAGFFQVKPRPYAALSLRLSGTGIFYIGGEKLVSNAGDILYIPANISYDVEYSVNEIIVIHLSECNYPHPEIILSQNQLVAENHFLNLLDAWNHKCSVFMVKSYIYELLDTLAKSSCSLTDHAILPQCTKYIEDHFCEADMNIEKMCKEMHVSRSTLQRVFLEYLKVSPHQYLTKTRMDYALKLIADGKLTVKEVSLACGFSDEKYFSVVFKKMYNCSPSHIRNNFIV